MMEPIRKEVVFSEADKDLVEYIEAHGIGYGPFIKQALREHKVMKDLRVDYDRIRRIVEDVVGEKVISVIDAERPHTAPKEVKNFFGIGKRI